MNCYYCNRKNAEKTYKSAYEKTLLADGYFSCEECNERERLCVKCYQGGSFHKMLERHKYSHKQIDLV